MNTDFDKKPGQRKPYLLMSGVAVAVCLFVAALMERRRQAASTEAARRARSFRVPVPPDAPPARDADSDHSTAWTSAGPSGDPVWESDDVAAARSPWTTALAPEDVAAEAEPFDGEQEVISPFGPQPVEAEAHVEPETADIAILEPEVQVEVEGWRPMPEAGGWHPETGPDPAPEAESVPAPDVWQPAPEAEVAPAPNVWQPAPEAEVAPAPNVWQPAAEAEAVEAANVWQPAAEAEAVEAPNVWQPAAEAEVAPAANVWQPAPEAEVAPAANVWQPAPEAEVAPAPNVWQPAPEAEVAPAPNVWQPAPEAEVAPAPNAWQPAPEAEVAPAPNAWQPAPQAEAAPAANVWQPAPEGEVWQPAVEAESETVESGPVADEPVADEPAPVAAPWFGSPTPPAATTWQPPSVDPPADDAGLEPTPEPAESEYGPESVIELPAAPEASAPPEDSKRLPPPRLRRWMGTGSTVLAIGLVLGAGILASGATADSTSDPATVPDAVGTTAPAPAALADTTAADTTTTDTTTVPDTTTTDTTTTDTTTTATTTTTDTTTTGTTTTDTTSTSTTPVEPPPTTSTPTPPPVDPAPVDPPASDPAVAPATPAVPDASAPADPQTTPVSTLPATPVAPTTPVTPAKPKVKKKTPTTTHRQATTPPAKAGTGATPAVGAPASSAAPVVTLASGSDPIGSILSANSVIPAVDASLLPTPAQVSFYVQASKPLPPLPTLARIDHPVAQRLVSAGRNGKVGWTVLAAVARLESNLGKRPGPLAGRNLPTTPSGDGLAALATFLHEHGARKNPLAPATAKKALTLYFDGSTRKADRAIALAALYGALGPAGMQHGVRAETARLQRRVLKDKRVHLTVAGRSDIRHGRVDPRVLVTLEYLANSFRKLGVSDLVSGGALFSRSGSVSAHLYGRAADVASLHGRVVKGHQGPGTMTELAIRRLLLLPKSLRPRQVISLMDVDGPTGNHGSFALPDHYDRIQIDY